MTEEKVRKRGWVKNAAIIFLSVMLVLTFFSNTIMNRSLPEVAAQYAQSGDITTRIRGTGTVEANEVYQVVFDQSREVESVAVRVGDMVEAGDVLCYLADTDSAELKQAEDTLDSLNYQYQESVLNASQSDYARENRDIQMAKEALEEAIADRDAMVVTAEEIQAAEDALAMAKISVLNQTSIVASKQEDVDEAQAALDALGGRTEGNDNSAAYAAMQAAQAALEDAKAALNTAKLRFQDKYDDLHQLAEDQKAAKEAVSGAPVYDVSIYMAALAAEYANDATLDAGQVYTRAEMAQAYEAITGAQATVDDCQIAYNQARTDYYDSADSGNAQQYDKLAAALRAAQADLNDAKAELTVKQEIQTKRGERPDGDQHAYDGVRGGRRDGQTEAGGAGG